MSNRKSRKSAWLTILVGMIVLTSLLVGCSPSAQNNDIVHNTRDVLVQVSTIDAILNGVYDGVISFDTLNKYGDFGIGTFDSLDGEMLAFDGNFYQIKSDGKAYSVSNSMKTPFASLTFFDIDQQEQLPEGVDFQQTTKILDAKLPTGNIFYAIRIDGIFSYMKVRSVPGQKKPFPPLVEVTKNQPVFEMNNIEGTIVGFGCPPYVSGVNVPGYHLHFLTKNKDAGGHILDFKVKQATALIDHTSEFSLLLPGKESDFYKIDLTQNKQKELEKAEK